MNNDLISRSELKEDLKQYFSDGILESVSAKLVFNTILKIIGNAPTVETDIEEVGKDAYKQGYTDGWKERFGEPNERPQGEWIRKCNEHRVDIICTNCGYDEGYCCFKYCPNCGADMRKAVRNVKANL